MIRASKMSCRQISDIPVGNLVMGSFGGGQKFVGIRSSYRGDDGFVLFEIKDGKKTTVFEDVDNAILLDLGSEWDVFVDQPSDVLDGRGRMSGREVDFGLIVTEKSQYLNVFFRSDYNRLVIEYLNLSGKRGEWDNEMGPHIEMNLFTGFKFVLPGDEKFGASATVIDPWKL